ITRFVGQVHGRSGFAPPIPATITCGLVEENLANNHALASALLRRGWDVRTFWDRDAHNWIAWRDAMHPHLAELLLRAWTGPGATSSSARRACSRTVTTAGRCSSSRRSSASAGTGRTPA